MFSFGAKKSNYWRPKEQKYVHPVRTIPGQNVGCVGVH